MDTIELAWSVDGMTEAFLKNAERRSIKRSYRDKDTRRAVRGRYGYNSAVSFVREAKDCYAAYGPMYSRSKRHDDLLIQVHLSQFNNEKHFKAWIGELLHPFEAQLDNASVKRLDTCVDIAVPYATALRAISLPNVTVTKEYNSRDNFCSVQFGRFPRTMAMYEKNFFNKLSFDYLPNNVHFCTRHKKYFGTRIEMRHRAKKVLISKYGDIKSLATMNPFHDVSTKYLDDANLQEIEDTKRRETLAAYQLCQDAYSSQVARSIFSRSNNFSKQIMPFLVPFKINLEVVWKIRINRFLYGSIEEPDPQGEHDFKFISDNLYNVDPELILGGDDESEQD